MIQLLVGFHSLLISQIVSSAMQVSRCLAFCVAGAFLFSGVLAARPEKCASGSLQADRDPDEEKLQMLAQIQKDKGIDADPVPNSKNNEFEPGRKVCGQDAKGKLKCCFATGVEIQEFRDSYWHARCTNANCCCDDGMEVVGPDFKKPRLMDDHFKCGKLKNL